MKSILNMENILLVAIWGIAIITGFFALGRVHSIAVRVGLVYTMVHALRYSKWIMSCCGIDIGKDSFLGKLGLACQSAKCNRAIKVVLALVFHVLLHVVSIHLAVAYTVLHVVQHRHGIASFFKKRSPNTRNSRSSQKDLLTA